jgi:2-oxoglutarate ferredoxin oxidoreductase subunit alpha
LRKNGLKVGLFRPISLYPYPYAELGKIGRKASTKAFLSVELNLGQMVEDVRLATQDRKPIHFYGRQGGNVPSPEEVIAEVKKLRKTWH